MTTKELSDSQQEKLISILRGVERADSPASAVWLDEESRKEVQKIRETIQ